jgi:hypothetical protein
MIRAAFFLICISFLVLVSCAETTTEECVKLTELEVEDLFTGWNAALATENSQTVADRYHTGAVLLATVEDDPRDTQVEIKSYFDEFLKKKPQGVIKYNQIERGCGFAVDMGTYEFTMGKDGSTVLARYSFIYTYDASATPTWKIEHHHSSVMPEKFLEECVKLTGKQVTDLFNLWNTALATLDSNQVVARYTDNAVLLATVADDSKVGKVEIKGYFDKFLLNKPQGVIKESYPLADCNTATDMGIYEFTMGIDGSKVKARYSYLYNYDSVSQTWKIAHHHSSMLPEQFLDDSGMSFVKAGIFSLFGLLALLLF